MKFFIKTYGCQMNVRDSQSVEVLLERHGLERARSEAQADLIIVNTCSVRGKAEDKAIGKLGILAASKREHPERLVGAMGCMVQRLRESLFERVPKLDFAVGTRRFASIPAILDFIQSGQKHVLDVGTEDENFEALTGHEEGALSAFVNVLFGCDRRCAYCIVPDVRGREWSRPGESIVQEVTSLARSGVKEVTLLGQSVMMYGRRNPVWPDESRSPRGFVEPFIRLLEAVCGIEGIRRVRFTSSHPSGCTAELAEAMKALPALCPHLHLPLQSGSDRVLKRMRRGYLSADYRAAVERLRDAVPELAITTDIIVGFPSETAAEFEETRTFMETIGFDNAFVFKYSPRPGTPAAAWEDDVSDDEKLRRNKVLLDDQDQRGRRLNEQLVGNVVEVMVEGESLRNSARWSGRSRTNKIVVFDPVPGCEVGDLIRVRIDRAMPQTLYGSIEKG
ncbi:MAG: tRNA (N6-isopentenyl adenosine(37)-C2)-methylthiotransferase MiaB [Verrucomicrobia bacterium]|jgi:tRNA-2-methylthio-N6-dimethylallyladenosine synthase|nr:tRNA (N6-isopentenyl adenosine(37)-C2)-methylthiotransferase MiaB [Verrucomicrobiota bacterium]